MSPQAYTINCEGCGSSVPVADVDQRLFCPFCGTQADLSEEQREAFEEHARNVARVKRRIAFEQEVTEEDAHLQGPAGAGKGCFILVAIITAFAGLPLGIVYFFKTIEPGDWIRTLTLAVMIFVVPAVVLFALGFLIFRRRRARARGVSLEGIQIQCPDCGAVNSAAPGVVITACQHCDASLLSDEQVLEAGRQRVDRAAVLAETERHLNKWHYHWVCAGKLPKWPYLFLGVAAILVVGWSAYAASKTTLGLQVGNVVYPLGVFVILAFLLFAHDAVKLFRRDRAAPGQSEDWKRAVGTILGSSRKLDSGGDSHAAQWFGVHWSLFPDIGALTPRSRMLAVSFANRSFAGILVINPTMGVAIFLSAWLFAPAQLKKVAAHPNIRETRTRLGPLGLEVSVTKSGISVHGDAHAAHQVKTVSAAQQTLSQALDLAVASLEETGSRPGCVPRLEHDIPDDFY